MRGSKEVQATAGILRLIDRRNGSQVQPTRGDTLMFGKFKIAAASALIAMGSLAAVPSTASAGDIDVDVYLGGGAIGVGFGGGYGGGFGGGYGGGYGGGHGPKCSPWKAEAKARHMGLRHARVVDVGHNKIVVKGKKWGATRTVIFGRGASCPIKASW